jgi:hypothetical protein
VRAYGAESEALALLDEFLEATAGA